MQRHLRLRRKHDFAHLRKTGRLWRHPFLLLSVAPNALTTNRYAFVASRQLGNAVVRNRTRRLLREAVRQVHPALKTGYDMAFIARAPLVGQPFLSVVHAVTVSLRQAGLWNPQGESQ